MGEKSEDRGPLNLHLISKLRHNLIVHCLCVPAAYSLLFVIFFSPVLFRNGLLAPGEGWSQSFSAFASRLTLWTPLIWAGFPAAADPTMQSWYPLSLIFSKIFNSWNAFVLSAYVLSASFTYGAVYSLTRCRMAAIAGGIIYGMSGFMMAHLGHTSMVHTAAWLPLLMWALAELRSRQSSLWFLVSAASVMCSVLAGHPQIFVYSIGLGIAYMLFLSFSEKGEWWKYFGVSLSSIALGVGLAAIQIFPTAELMKISNRAGLSYADFISYALHPLQTIEMLFPYLFGGAGPQGSFYKYGYFGPWNLAEMSGYIGLLPLLIVPAAMVGHKRKGMVWFWSAVGVIAFFLALGGSTPLAKLMYHVPAYNKFRVPARHFVEMTFAVSVLAGLGIAAVRQGRIAASLSRHIVIVGAAAMALGLLSILLFHDKLRTLALKHGVEILSLAPWSNATVVVPLLMSIAAGTVFLFWSRNPSSRLRQSLVLLILVADLGSFGWFCEWRYSSPDKEIMNTSSTVGKYRQTLNVKHQRLLPVLGSSALEVEVFPNISRYRGVPGIAGYGPFINPRLSELIPMGTTGRVWGDWSAPQNQGVNILSGRYLFLPRNEMESVSSQGKKGAVLSRDNMELTLGFGCGIRHPGQAEFFVPTAITATSLYVVSSLACSTDTVQDANVLRVRITTASGREHILYLSSGRDTSEWAYDCADVRPKMKHKRAHIYESFPVIRESQESCEGHHYLTRLPLGETASIAKIQLQWIGKSEAITIHKISLHDDATGMSFPVGSASSNLANPLRWRHIEDVGETSIYENLWAMPRAWPVREVVSLKPEEILRTVKSSVMPDNRAFDPSTSALVEEPYEFGTVNTGGEATVHIVHIDDADVEIRTESGSPFFLVLSDIYYPGWKAAIDGNPTHIFRTDYVLRGVSVPSGGHVIRFEFSPTSFYIGAGISVISLFVLAGLSFIFVNKRGNMANDK